MSNSESTTAKEWILNLPQGSWFWSVNVPGRREIVHPVLSRLHKNAANGVVKVAHKLYWRGFDPDHKRSWMKYNVTIASLLLAGKGAGLNALMR